MGIRCARGRFPDDKAMTGWLAKDFVPTFRGRVLSDVPPLNPAKVSSVGFIIADKQDGAFRLEIAWMRAGGSKPD